MTRLHESTYTYRDPSALTPSEQEALRMFTQLGNYRDVADALGLKGATLRERMATIRAKLNVASNAELLNAIRTGE